MTTSPFQTLTEKDKEIIQMSVDDIYVKFITKVAEGRSMSVEEVDGIARGKVWIGEKALEIGLIDELGDLEDAILAAAELAKLEANNYGVKAILREDQGLGFAFSIATKFKTLLEYYGFTFASESYQPVLNWLQLQTQILSELNDPRGIYYHCFCSVQ